MRSIDLYTYTYNDEDFLPFFLDYYKFVDRMTFIDSCSTDRTIEILEEFSANGKPIIRIAETGLTWWDHEALHQYRNNIWKGSPYDLVFFPDLDEIFYHPTLLQFLKKSKCDIYEMTGYEMVANELPPIGTPITSIKKGIPFHMYNKSTIFNPKIKIEFLNAHLRYSRCTNVNMGEVKLLHYRNMGVSLMQKRRDREKARLPEKCSYRIFESNEQIKLRHQRMMRDATDVI